MSLFICSKCGSEDHITEDCPIVTGERTRFRAILKVPSIGTLTVWQPGESQFIYAEITYFAQGDKAAEEIAEYYAVQFDGAIVDEVTEL